MRQLFVLPAILILSSALLAGCGSSVPAVKPFKMDIQQGNVVTSKMLLQLKPGMTKSQVRFIMGTPLIVDSFHKDRWDYFYQMRQAGKIVEQRRVILDFEKDLLTKVHGDVVPQGTTGAAVDDAAVASAPITVEPKPKETTMWDKLKFWKKDENPVAKPEVKPELLAPAAVAIAPVEAATVTAADTKKTEAKVAVAHEAIAKSATEKSWLDKLKFWKKDETTTAEKVAPIVVAAPEVASVLAVPIDLPSDAATATALPTESAVTTEPLKIEPLPTEPYDATQKPSITAKDSIKPLQSPSQKMQPSKPEPEKPAPEKPMPVASPASRPLKPLPLSAKNSEKLVFRMDKTLDLARGLAVKPEAVPVPATPLPEALSKPIKADVEPLPIEAEPSFFDKMLEKIGF